MNKRAVPNQRELLILAILADGPLFGRELGDAYEKLAMDGMPKGSLYTTLGRMVEKGLLIRSQSNEPGYVKVYFAATVEGRRVCNQFAQAFSKKG
jgi:DNA-binding PadR family transcriptional regulator